MTKQVYDRKQQGELIAQAQGSIERLDDKTYLVTSQSRNTRYRVRLIESDLVCSCPDYNYRGVKCKHIHAIDTLR